jgi:RimJ/RimL family protein N-acetyltransferase
MDETYTRELRTGLPPEVLAVGAPPTPVPDGPWEIRPATADGADLDLVHRWMNAPHVAPFWDQAWPKERWARTLAGQLAGDYSRPYIVHWRGREFAYLELYRCAKDVVARHYPALPHDIGYHGAVGEADLAGRGLALHFLLKLIPAIFAAEPGCTRVLTEPEAGNRAARRIDQALADRVGGTLLGEIELPHKRAALFAYPRTPADLPRGCSTAAVATTVDSVGP